MTELLLDLRGLDVRYGAIRAVKSLDLHVHAGEHVTLIGANGAGKTSTLRALTGLIETSGGEQQMLALGRALLSQPRLLVLDEPSMGLAPTMVERIFEAITEVCRRGITLLLVEQNARLALQVTERAYVLDSGEVTVSGASRALLDDPQVRAAYLGD